MHIRSVEWLTTVQRSVFPKDILFSMNSALTLFKVTRNDAEARVKKILALPASVSEPTAENAEDEIEDVADDDAVNLEVAARDEILVTHHSTEVDLAGNGGSFPVVT